IIQINSTSLHNKFNTMVSVNAAASTSQTYETQLRTVLRQRLPPPPAYLDNPQNPDFNFPSHQPVNDNSSHNDMPSLIDQSHYPSRALLNLTDGNNIEAILMNTNYDKLITDHLQNHKHLIFFARTFYDLQWEHMKLVKHVQGLRESLGTLAENALNFGMLEQIKIGEEYRITEEINRINKEKEKRIKGKMVVKEEREEGEISSTVAEPSTAVETAPIPIPPPIITDQMVENDIASAIGHLRYRPPPTQTTDPRPNAPTPNQQRNRPRGSRGGSRRSSQSSTNSYRSAPVLLPNRPNQQQTVRTRVRPSRRPNSRDACFNCNGFRHFAHSCSTWVCNHCNQQSPGHYPSTCPQRPFLQPRRPNIPDSDYDNDYDDVTASNICDEPVHY
ncbi:hypothetical protein AAF712_016176, partial [Marasmius tenuissimus]